MSEWIPDDNIKRDIHVYWLSIMGLQETSIIISENSKYLLHLWSLKTMLELYDAKKKNQIRPVILIPNIHTHHFVVSE